MKSEVEVNMEIMKDVIFTIEKQLLFSRATVIGPTGLDLGNIPHDFVNSEIFAATNKLLDSILNINFHPELIKNVIDPINFAEIFSKSVDNESFRNLFQEFFHHFISSAGDDNACFQQLNVFLVAVLLLYIFIQSNWINLSTFADESTNFYQLEKSQVLSYLAVGEATVYHLLKSPHLLLMSEILLEQLSQNRKGHCLQTVDWWLFRVYNIHQNVLDERSRDMFEKISAIISDRNSAWFSNDWKLETMFHLECAHLMLYYHKTEEAKRFIDEARLASGLTITLTGALGKRTQYQQNPIPQLVVIPQEAQQSKRGEVESPTPEALSLLPKNVQLNDDSLLNEIEFVDSPAVNCVCLHPEEQAILLVHSMYIKRSNPVHVLVNEEIMSFIQYILKEPKVWSIQQMGLVLRSKLENKKTKTVERSMIQIEEIVNNYRQPNIDFNVEKFRLFFAVCPLPHWETEAELGRLLMSLGVVKSALDVFTRLEMWEEVILCYHLLQRRNQAEKLIRQMLEEEQTVKLWCLLGDSTDDITHYETAWELSNHKSARSQRSIGNFYYQKGQYSEALPYFLNSVKINFSQPEIWFSVAFCANHLKDHNLAAKAYRKCVSVEPENFEAWNNLANTYIQLRQKGRAFLALQEAMRINYENWHIWENYLLVSADCGEFEEVLKSSHRVLDLKPKHYDLEVLNILVRAVINDIPDARGVGAKRLQKNCEKLFGRITSVVLDDPKIWDLYADLAMPQQNKTVEIWEKVMHRQQKAHHCLTRDMNWYRETADCVAVMKNAIKLSGIYRDVSNSKSGSLIDLNMQKLMLNGIISSIRKKIDNSVTDIDLVIKELLEELETHRLENLQAIETIQESH